MLMLVLALSPVLVTAAPEAEPLLGGLYPGPGAVLGYCANQGVCVPPVHCSAHYYHLAQVQTCKPCWKMLSNFGENAQFQVLLHFKNITSDRVFILYYQINT